MSCGDAAEYLGPEAEPAPGLWCNKPTAQTTEEPSSDEVIQLEGHAADEGIDGDGDGRDAGDEDDDSDADDDDRGTSSNFCRRNRRRGFLRDRKLGLWLRLLWERSSGYPDTRRRLLSAAEDHCDAGLWREALASVCGRLGRSRHLWPQEALPVYGGSTVVFKLGKTRPCHNHTTPSPLWYPQYPPPPSSLMLALCLVAPLLGWRHQGLMMLRRKGTLSQERLRENSIAHRAASW